MKYLNLTEGFNPFDIPEDGVNNIRFKSFFFNGGEPHIKIHSKFINEDVYITCRINSMDDLGMLMVANEAIMESGWLKEKHLFLPYFPGARQDRRMVYGEPLTAKVYAEVINDMGFDYITIFDPHSDVTPALLNNCEVMNNLELFRNVYTKINTNPLLISPDAGSNKKIHTLASFIEEDFIRCDKYRDVTNGEILGFKVYSNDLKGRDCIIVDDICDGGGTFIGLAKELKKKNAGDIYLIVSHGIFSKPLKGLKPYFKKIYTTDSWRSEFGWEQRERDATDLVEIVKFKDFI